jgi:16S rRNA (cytosine1402-N4)-methyltransferase
LSSYPDTTLWQLNFSQIDRLKELAGAEKFTGILFDLGIGSWQISQAERGFSYLLDGPLDMRMDQSQKFSAYQVVNHYSQEELARIFKEYGEERLGKRIAREIKQARQKIMTTAQLGKIIEKSISPRNRVKTLSRIFQAIRMEVNQEIEELKAGLSLAVQAAESKGRIGIISYHSLEDRLVKQTFQELARKCICPPGSPVCTCGGKAKWSIITKKPVRPSSTEIKANPSARSAKFRVIEKLEQPV